MPSPQHFPGVGKDGFSLAELMVAVCLLGVVSSSLLALTNWAFHATAFAQQMTEAATLGHNKVEEMLAADASLTPGTETRGRYTLTWTVSELNGSQGIRTTVAWTSAMGRRHSIALANLRRP